MILNNIYTKYVIRVKMERFKGWKADVFFNDQSFQPPRQYLPSQGFLNMEDRLMNSLSCIRPSSDQLPGSAYPLSCF